MDLIGTRAFEVFLIGDDPSEIAYSDGMERIREVVGFVETLFRFG